MGILAVEERLLFLPLKLLLHEHLVSTAALSAFQNHVMVLQCESFTF